MALALLSARFQSFPLLPTIKLGPSGADSRVGELVHALGPCGSLQQTLLWGWAFLPLPPQPPQVFSVRALRLYFPLLEPWVVRSVLLPNCSFQFLCMRMRDHPLYQPPTRPVLQPQPCCESFPPLLPVWVSVSSLIPWLSDLHTVRFPVSSGCFFNCCCPSFGCTRRHSVSTYASILAKSPAHSVFT